MTRRSVAEARRELPALIRTVERGGEVEVTRRGRLVAVLVGLEQYRRVSGAERSFWNALSSLRQAHGVAGLRIGTGWARRVRSRDKGRGSPW